MNHIKHPLCNDKLLPPLGEEETVDTLYIQRGSSDGVMCVRSFWTLTPQELRCASQGGVVALSVLGRTHPPLRLEVMNPEQGVDDAFVHDEALLVELCADYGKRSHQGYIPAQLTDIMKSYAMQMLRRYGK